MKNKEEKKDKWKYSWAIQALFITFCLSLLISFLSTNAINNLSLFPAILILLIVIFLGVVADIIGVAVTVGNEEDFHAKASKKIEGAKSSIKLIRNYAKVANICCDVININTNFLISAVVAAVTVGSKAAGKVMGQEHSTKIVHVVGTAFNKFIK